MDSILCQTHPEFELLVVDDASTDESGDILSAMRDRGSGSSGMKSTWIWSRRSTKAGLAQGSMSPGWTRTTSACRSAWRNRRRSWTGTGRGRRGGGARLIDERDRPGAVLPLLTGHDLLRWSFCFGCPIAHAGVMMRRSQILEVGAYREEAFRCEDYDLWTRAAGKNQAGDDPGGAAAPAPAASSMTRVWPEDNVGMPCASRRPISGRSWARSRRRGAPDLWLQEVRTPPMRRRQRTGSAASVTQCCPILPWLSWNEGESVSTPRRGCSCFSQGGFRIRPCGRHWAGP